MTGQAPHVELHSPRSTLADTLALLAPLLHTQLRAAMIAELEQRYVETPAGLPTAERQRRLAELDAEIARLESLEEQAIVVAREAGMDVLRRPDVSPSVLLGLDA
jgi:adenosyl cobinamide kinase/adenosyl cobinamide phosphate guanylyltransferase